MVVSPLEEDRMMQIPDRWIISHGFVIRHKPTGHYIPNIAPGHRRGGSLVEPEDPKKSNPRVFVSERSAVAYLIQWCKGKHICTRTGEYDSYDEVTEIVPQPHRIREDMEIIPVVLMPKEF